MAMRLRSPWWLSAVLAVGLVAIFGGQRAFAHKDGLSLVLTLLGLLLFLGATGLRAFVWIKASGRLKRVEGISLLCHAGMLVALLGYYLGTETGAEFLGQKPDGKFGTAITVIWSILMVCSMVPLLMIELIQGMASRTSLRTDADAAEASVDLFRVREMASSGVSIGLALAFLMVTCNIADQRNIRKDVSYFKTSSPGTATVNMVKSMSEPLQVYLWFPEVNEVAEEVEGYFEFLKQKTGNVIIERKDQYIDSKMAEEYRVSRPGTILLVRGTKPPEDENADKGDKAGAKDDDEEEDSDFKKESFTVSTEMEKARRTELREFDEKVQKAVMKVIRERRVAYFSKGHGEVNDPESAGPLAQAIPGARATLIKELLRVLNYQVKDWDGLGKPVPDDCSILFVLGPRRDLLDEEWSAIDEYISTGGRALIALDPDGDARLDKLSGRLGVNFDPTGLADDKEFMVRTRSPADHRLLLTNQFSSHASVTTLSRGAAQAGILFVRPGSLSEVPFTEKTGDADPKRTFVIRSMGSSFRDENNNLTYDKDSEKRDRYSIVAAIEDPSAVPKSVKGSEDHEGSRVFVVADAEVFTDGLIAPIKPIQDLVVDAVKWLGGEEAFAGTTESEKDVRIEHTKSKDAIWFYSTVVGAPLLVLGLGLGLMLLRRRMIARRSS